MAGRGDGMNVAPEQAKKEWDTTIRLYEEMHTCSVEAHGHSLLAPMIRLVKRLAQGPLAQCLIAGQSHETLVIAELRDICAPEGPPYIAVDVLRDGSFECRLVDGNPRTILERQKCAESQAEAVATEFMGKLLKLIDSKRSQAHHDNKHDSLRS